MRTMQAFQQKRKRKGKTNYRARVKLLMSNKPRLVIRKTNTRIITQIVNYDQKGDRVVAAADSSELKKLGWNLGTKNITAAYLTGLLLGKRAKIKEAVLDIGLTPSVKGSKIYAALKGAIDSGIKVPCSQNMFPEQKRLSGEHLKKEAKQEIEKIKQKITK